jgi:hypothetical protein
VIKNQNIRKLATPQPVQRNALKSAAVNVCAVITAAIAAGWIIGSFRPALVPLKPVPGFEAAPSLTVTLPSKTARPGTEVKSAEPLAGKNSSLETSRTADAEAELARQMRLYSVELKAVQKVGGTVMAAARETFLYPCNEPVRQKFIDVAGEYATKYRLLQKRLQTDRKWNIEGRILAEARGGESSRDSLDGIMNAKYEPFNAMMTAVGHRQLHFGELYKKHPEAKHFESSFGTSGLIETPNSQLHKIVPVPGSKFTPYCTFKTGFT